MRWCTVGGDAILGNIGTIISFRLGLADAEIPQKEFYHEFASIDRVNPPKYNTLTLMVDRSVTRPFSGETFQSREH